MQMQALEFEAVAALRKFGNGRDRQCVVGGELRKMRGRSASSLRAQAM